MAFISLNNNKSDWNYTDKQTIIRHGIGVEIEKEWKAEQVVEVKKAVKPKTKSKSKNSN